jgi:hypothetical protein
VSRNAPSGFLLSTPSFWIADASPEPIPSAARPRASASSAPISMAIRLG